MLKNNFSEYIHKYSVDDSICTLISINTNNLTYNLTPENFLFSGEKNIPNDRLFIKKSGKYLIGYHKGSYDTIESTYNRMMRYIKNNNLKLGHYSYVKELLDALTSASKNEQLLKVIIEVK